MPSGGPWLGAASSLAVVHPQRRRMARVGPAQSPVLRVVGHAAAVTKSLLVPARSTRAVLAQLSSWRGSSEKGAVAANTVRTNAARRAGLQAVPDDVADDQQRGVLRALGDEVEVAADLLGVSGHEGGGELQAGALGATRAA